MADAVASVAPEIFFPADDGFLVRGQARDMLADVLRDQVRALRMPRVGAGAAQTHSESKREYNFSGQPAIVLIVNALRRPLVCFW